MAHPPVAVCPAAAADCDPFKGSLKLSSRHRPNHTHRGAQLWPKFQAFLKAPAGSGAEATARGELLEQLKVGSWC